MQQGSSITRGCISHFTEASRSNPFPFLHLGCSSSPTSDGVRWIYLSHVRLHGPSIPHSSPLSAAFSGCLTQLAWIANPASSLAAPRSSVAVRLVHPSSLSNSQDCFSRERTEKETGGGRRWPRGESLSCRWKGERCMSPILPQG